jgi:hypothetical protein
MRRALPLCLLLVLPAAGFAQGTVTTTQTETEITIDAGDGAKFDVKVGKDAQDNDVLVIEGKDGTTINGDPKFEIRLNPGINKFEQVEVNGGDEVTIDLQNMPEDRRLEEVDVNFTDKVTVKNVQTTAGGKIRVGGSDDATVEDCDTSHLNIVKGDKATVRRCNVDTRLRIVNDEGNVDATVEDTFYQQGQFGVKDSKTVQGSLKTRVRRSTGGKVSFQGASSDDEVVFEDSTAQQVAVKLGDGADLASFAGTTIDKLSLDGGRGELDCFDENEDGNVFASLKLKGFEPLGCLGGELEFLFPGSSPFVEPPEGAVAWKVQNGGHEDGPFALPGQDDLGLEVRDPTDVDPGDWGIGPECVIGMAQAFHVHGPFEGHADPDEFGCGHGVLLWGFLEPI